MFLFKYKLSCFAAKRDTQRKDFPQKNAIGPDVALHSVHPFKNTLRSHPLHGQTHLQKWHVNDYNYKSTKRRPVTSKLSYTHPKYLHFLLRRSWNHIQCLWRGQSRRSSLVCHVSPKHFWLPSPYGYTVGTKCGQERCQFHI